MTQSAQAPQGAPDMDAQKQAVRDLLEMGKKKGKLTLKEMADALADVNLESDQLDKLYETLESMGIEIEGAELAALDLVDEDEEFEAEKIEEVPEEELADPSAMAENFAIDDPVRMYLKEIGKVDLLSPEEEVKLAEQMLAGNDAVKTLKEKSSALTDEERRTLTRAISAGERAK